MYHSVQGFVGIILYGFHGFQRQTVVEGFLFDKLMTLRQSLDNRDPNSMILQICPMQKIYMTHIFRTILAYNILNICQIMTSYIQDSRKSLSLLPAENGRRRRLSTRRNSSGSGNSPLSNGIANGPGLAVCPP